MLVDDLAKRIEELRRKNCGHKCHSQGLNPWIRSCPICGCPNPKYDEGATSDFGGPRKVAV